MQIILVVAAVAVLLPSISVTGSKIERVILDTYHTVLGVPIDYSYNETESDFEGGRRSSPGCPKNVAGYPWVHYRTVSGMKCFLVGETGPCKNYQKLFVRGGDLCGYCNCDCLDGSNDVDGGSNGIKFCNITTWTPLDIQEVAYCPGRDNQCYQIYQQRPCNEGDWLVKVKGPPFSVRCEKRKCPEGQIPSESSSDDLSSNCMFHGGVGGASAGFGGSVGYVQPKECEAQNMVYSSLLRKCVKKFGKSNFG